MSPPSTMDRSEARLALQVAADELFYREGIVGVTIAAIRDASGVSLRRIYELCPSKSDLISLWLHHRHETWTAAFTASVSAELATHNSPVDAVFTALESWMVATDFRGCGFINTHAEASELSDEHVQIIRDHKRSLADYLSQVTGQGDAMAVLIDGAIVQASIFSSTQPIRQARLVAMALTDPTSR